MEDKVYNFGSMFAGVGGIDLGMIQAGFVHKWANDRDEKAIETFSLNFPDSMIPGDINELDPSEFSKVDVITAGFPCQPFSVAGKLEGFKDEGRGNLFFSIMKLVDHLEPSVVLLENVKNLVFHDKGNTIKVILENLDKRGYKVHHQILAGNVHGNIPQGRERIFIVAFKDDEAFERFEFPSPIPLTIKPHQLIDDTALEKYYYRDTKNYDMLINEMTDFNAVYQLRRGYVRKNKSGVCPTLTANAGTGGHNVPIIWDKEDIRKLTPREMFNFQGYPDSFRLPEGMADSHLYYQAGNSVVVPVVRRIAEEILNALQVTDG